MDKRSSDEQPASIRTVTKAKYLVTTHQAQAQEVGYIGPRLGRHFQNTDNIILLGEAKI